ncbi:DeoR/GlpR family DNA-binding transcription regulator [Pectinatus sottacetonis]|uniref:DeoR/GlpR family DNA-binding transcription regulator n=1 Tax=Pectinatus sottacetonis TaxID=1002795 RepID=UPI0018C84653|nr:DeoR/GlpR family DNA-binding transcription regulator [Pectinatus sottacetonis]
MTSRIRRSHIIGHLEKCNTVYITELAEKFAVSSMTIRRDLEFLAKQGLVTLIRGGATLNHGAAFLYSQSFRQTKFIKEKHRIAEYCASLINEGSSIFLDCGSTTQKIAETILPMNNITVITHSLECAQTLSTAKKLKLIMAPGVYSTSMGGFLGQFTCEFIKNFHIDILFLGANGVDTEHGLSSPDYIDALTKRALINASRKVIIATDSSKLNLNFFVTVASLQEIDSIVTDKNAAPDVIDAMRSKGINIVLV